MPHASSQRLAGANNYMVEDANHFTICRPPTKNHPNYFKLVECLKICLKVNFQLFICMAHSLFISFEYLQFELENVPYLLGQPIYTLILL